MSSATFERFFTNVDVLIEIYKLLNLKDQLSLACVNEDLRCVYLNYINKETYERLTIVKRTPALFVANTTNPTPVQLQPVQFRNFLQVHAENVLELCEKSSLKKQSNGNRIPSAVIDVTPFRNLISLTYESAAMPHDHLKLVARCCPKLQRLRLVNCAGTRYLMGDNSQQFAAWEFLLMDDAFAMLLTMKNLRHFSTEFPTPSPPRIKYQHFRELVTKGNLETLNLCNAVLPDPELMRNDTKVSTLKELTIATTLDYRKWPNFSSFLSNFEKLEILTISLFDDVTPNILKVLARTCKSLKTLNIHNSNFVGIKTFEIPAKVTELSLHKCSGLTFGNLKQILTLLKIKKFTSIDTEYTGTTCQFKISTLIESLSLDSIYMNFFQRSYQGSTNIKELIWHSDDDYCNEGMVEVALETCTNLRTVTVRGVYVPYKSLIQLNNLNKLDIRLPFWFDHFSWSYVTALLKHPPLRELSIDCAPKAFSGCQLESKDAPTEAFHSNLQSLTIYVQFFYPGMRFWLDLFNRNAQLKLVLSNYSKDFFILKRLIENDRFPKDLKTLNIWGSSIVCEDLRNNLKDMRYNLEMRYLDELKPDFKEINQMIFCRSNKPKCTK